MKDHVIIFGAGPVGLYFAIKLRRLGVAVRVFDRRAGDYIRPGHLNQGVFQHIEQEFGQRFWSFDKNGHIKDLERQLYKQAVDSGVSFEKLQFLRFDPAAGDKCIITQDAEGTEHAFASDYVFDCTGEKRALVHGANQVVSPPPFQISRVLDNLDVKKNFLAYVKMSSENYQLIRQTHQPISYLVYPSAIKQLRDYGWKEFTMPYCYGARFGEKMCIYIECPDELRPEQYDSWVNLVLTLFDKSARLLHERLPESTHTQKKPRYNAFIVDPVMIDKHMHQSPGLPTIFVLGDAQIGFHHRRANGVENGFKRVRTLLEHTRIESGKIHIDADNYAVAVKQDIETHCQSLTQCDDALKEILRLGLYKTLEDLTKNAAILQFDPFYRPLLSEAQARHGFHEGSKQLTSLCHSNGRLIPPTDTIKAAALSITLNTIQNYMQKAQNDLPPERVADRKQNSKNLIQLAAAWKELGSYCFRMNTLLPAENAYKKALALYQQDDPGASSSTDVPNSYKLEKLTLRSNLAVTYRKQGRLTAALEMAVNALNAEALTPALRDIQSKLFYHGIKSCIELLHRKEPRQTPVNLQAITRLISQTQDHITADVLQMLQADLSEIADYGRAPSTSNHVLSTSNKAIGFFAGHKENIDAAGAAPSFMAGQ